MATFTFNFLAHVRSFFTIYFFDRLNATTLTPSEDKSASVSHDEVLIDYLIENSFLWDKSNSSYRNRALKDSKWNEIADKLHLTGKFSLIFSN